MPPREGSRKRSVYEHFQQHGEDAVVFGLSLGLKEGTIRSWLNGWKKGDQGAVTSRKITSSPSSRNVLIYDEWKGTVVASGPYQSEVRFNSGPPDLVGKVRVLINKDFRYV